MTPSVDSDAPTPYDPDDPEEAEFLGLPACPLCDLYHVGACVTPPGVDQS